MILRFFKRLGPDRIELLALGLQGCQLIGHFLGGRCIRFDTLRSRAPTTKGAA